MPAVKKPKFKLGRANEVTEALRARFAPPAWAFLTNVSNGTGSRANRWADAIAMSVWPSRGLDIHGFEVKISRKDFLRELKDPQKAEEIARFCDYWWIAVGDPEIVKTGELPSAWGLLVPMKTKDGVTMRIVVEASKRKAAAVDRTFLASLLRRSSEAYDPVRIKEEARREAQASAYEEANKRVAAQHLHTLNALNDQLETERKARRALEIQIQSMTDVHYTPQMIARAVELLGKIRGWNGAKATVDRLVSTIERDRQSMGMLMTTLVDMQTVYDELSDKTEE